MGKKIFSTSKMCLSNDEVEFLTFTAKTAGMPCEAGPSVATCGELELVGSGLVVVQPIGLRNEKPNSLSVYLPSSLSKLLENCSVLSGGSNSRRLSKSERSKTRVLIIFGASRSIGISR